MYSGANKDFVFELLIPKINNMKLGDLDRNRIAVRAYLSAFSVEENKNI